MTNKRELLRLYLNGDISKDELILTNEVIYVGVINLATGMAEVTSPSFEGKRIMTHEEFKELKGVQKIKIELTDGKVK